MIKYKFNEDKILKDIKDYIDGKNIKDLQKIIHYAIINIYLEQEVDNER